jgi:hypothetical protein
MVHFDLPPEQPSVEIVQPAATLNIASENIASEVAVNTSLDGFLGTAAADLTTEAVAVDVDIDIEPYAADNLQWVRDVSVGLSDRNAFPENRTGRLTAQQITQNSEADLPALEPAETPLEEVVPEAIPEESEPGASDDSEESAPNSEATQDAAQENPQETIEGPVQIEIETDETLTPEEFANRLQLDADYQEYDPETQIITARGNVILQLNDAIIEADELWVNLVNRFALANGNVLLTRGSQIVRGSSAEYNFIQQAGVVGNAVGTLYLPDLRTDLASPLEGRSPATRRAYDPIGGNSDLDVGTDGSVQISSTPDAEPAIGRDEGGLRQLRFETDELTFDVEGYRAESVRITNDPFSPPELELRASNLFLRNISPTQDELLLQRPRLVFDRGLSLPLLRRRILLSRGSVNPEDLSPVPAQIGIDSQERGGFYLGRRVPLTASERVRFSITPQFFIARAFSGESRSPIDFDNFGATADLSAQLSPRTRIEGRADLTSFNLSDFSEKLRTSIRAEQHIGDHRLALQYSYRERLFNGSLGFQDVRYSLGAVLLSPEIELGNGLQLNYQASAQLINAESDRPDLISSSDANRGQVTLGRFQASAALRQSFNLWRGEPRPATQSEGLRYTPESLVPYLNLNAGVRATGTYYSSGDFQDSLIAEVGIEGQLGHLARNFGDYTRFNVSYSQSFIGGADSPFLFDREVDRNVVSLGLTQQLYGPFLVGFQTAFSLTGGQNVDTAYTLEYSRRTYGILLRYDASQNTGAIGFRLSNFSWVGDTNPFDSPRLRRVEAGVVEE